MQDETTFLVLRQAIEQAPEAMLLTDVDDRLIIVSRGFTELTGLSAQDLGRRQAHFLCWKNQGGQRSGREDLVRGGLCECVTHIETANEKSVAVRFRCRAVLTDASPESPLLGYVTTCVPVGGEGEPDTSATKLRTYEALRAESLMRLASGIAHNFNNALAGLIGVASLARETHPDDPVLAHDLNDILAQARRMAEWTKHMLSYAKQDLRNPIRTDINRVVDDAVNLLRPSVSPRYKVSVEPGKDLPAVEVDPSQMQEVIEQVAVNAAEASGNKGSLRIVTERTLPPFTVRKKPNADVSFWVRVSFLDDGPGMTSETLSRVFDPFFSTRFTGRGLGLAVVKGIVESHGGRVMVQSAPDQGTRFDVLLPPASSREAQEKRGRKESPEPNVLNEHRMLVVEDEVLLANMLRDYFQHQGMQVLVAHSGARAMELLKSADVSPEICLMDIVMPDCMGTDLFFQMQKVCPAMAVLLCTAYQEAEPVRKLLDSGAVGLMRKPFEMKDLSNAVAAVFNKSAESTSSA